ncbi:MAG: nucleotidyltransferase [Oscillospiraceae bacterium]|nr:nucleotidyltransferase [Oscillospiraceae bacterium]
MAAGMGSRFGGLKQVTPVDAEGHPIIAFSLFDARRAGFRRVVFIIKHAIERDFRESVGSKAEQYFDVQYVLQETDCLPAGFSVPPERVKPWGTGHAVACCRGAVDAPFAVINADDFYGADAFRQIYGFLSAERRAGEWAMVGYALRNTLTENGTVARGICETENGFLKSVTERTKIAKRGGDAEATLPDGSVLALDGGSTVSMNFWGFTPEVPALLWEGLPAFLRQSLNSAPLTSEYFLPSFVSSAIDGGEATVRVLTSADSWFGVTYREDMDAVSRSVRALKTAGAYPQRLW